MAWERTKEKKSERSSEERNLLLESRLYYRQDCPPTSLGGAEAHGSGQAKHQQVLGAYSGVRNHSVC